MEEILMISFDYTIEEHKAFIDKMEEEAKNLGLVVGVGSFNGGIFRK